MKILFKAALALLLISLLLASPILALAADSVISFNDSDGIDARPGSSYTKTDLFDNFKSCMAGDLLYEDISLQNIGEEYDYINVYIKALPHDEASNPLSDGVADSGESVASMSDFLSQLYMKVYCGDKLIFSASPDEADGLSVPLFLGKLESGDDMSLSVELSVPEDLDNKFAYRTGEVDWVFSSEAFNYEDELIQTGQLNLPIPFLLSFGALFSVAGLFILIRSAKKENS